MKARTQLGSLLILLLFSDAFSFGQIAGEEGGSNVLPVAAGKSTVVTSQEPIDRVSIGSPDVAEASAVSPREVLVNGKTPGSTSLIIWQRGGGKLFFDVNVRPNRFLADNRFESMKRELAKELPGQTITVNANDDAIYLRGTARDLTSAQRAISIASTIGRVVNLMYIAVPQPEAQILLRVRFASLDRNRSKQLGFNLFSTNTGRNNTIGAGSTQQYPAPTLPTTGQQNNAANPWVFSDVLNIFLFRKDLDLGATIRDLEVKGFLQTLAEPNVLAQNGKQASFLAGGEFPYPVYQGSAGSTGAITIQFREFGVRLNFIPTITPNGSIKLQVAPEVSALDFTNGLTIQGFNVPALTTRKVKTEVELQEGQSFAIGGLLDKRVTETFEKMPFIGDIPVLGKLFQSKNTNRQNTELVLIVTPELVRPMPAGSPVPGLKYPVPFLESDNDKATRTPGMASTGAVPVTPPTQSIPMEDLLRSMQPEKPLDTSSTTSVYGSGGARDNTAVDKPQGNTSGAGPSVTKP